MNVPEQIVIVSSLFIDTNSYIDGRQAASEQVRQAFDDVVHSYINCRKEASEQICDAFDDIVR
ncbi:hypothetical protein PRIPAC_84419 [Pristionchus pacificus]|uniref:Uncharacterized protein n=1 Tax=Pristionchus pacificus TaxID=54126 RepID=A0A2A6BL38_PRIPA|nr:hypothetical protein PRIPAC_84419 [Pristionchus pacificus]|eukprot:PDM66625.1 hypothetical protein PRIPAC_48042 [Pristionchus pacificus]